jgi:hypothetical protein
MDVCKKRNNEIKHLNGFNINLLINGIIYSTNGFEYAANS